MQYYISKRIASSFDEAVQQVTDQLSAAGFGVLTQIDMKATIKKKLDKDMDDYIILGACHPSSAFAAVTAEPWIGLMLPCNVVVRKVDHGVEVAAVRPMASMMAIDNPDLHHIAQSVEERLRGVIDSL